MRACPLEEPDRSSVGVDVDVYGGGVVAEALHGLHVSAERHDMRSGDYLASASAS